MEYTFIHFAILGIYFGCLSKGRERGGLQGDNGFQVEWEDS